MNSAESPLIAIVAASLDEAELLRGAVEALDGLGVPYEMRIASLHAAPRELIEWASMAEARGVRTILAAAGGESGLSGAIAAACRLPVIAVHLAADRSAAAVPRAELSPSVLTAAGGAKQAALAAVRILAVADRRWRGPLEELRRAAEVELQRDNAAARAQWSSAGARAREQSLHALFPKHTHPSPEPAPVYDLTAAVATPEPQIAAANEEAEANIRKAEELYRPLAVKPAAVASHAAQDDDDLPAPGRSAERPSERPGPRKLGRLVIDPDSPDVATIEEAVDCLLEGGVIAFPTETVYGLAADATNPEAVERLFALKGRERTKAISLMVDSGKLLGAIAQNVTVEVRRLMEAFWPGPLTLVMQKRPGNFRHVSGENTIGVRLPDHSVPLAIMQALARPLACTSANLSGAPEARSGDEIMQLFGDRIDALLDGGSLAPRPASTVLDVSSDPFRILRQGAISREQIGAVVGEKLEEDA